MASGGAYQVYISRFVPASGGEPESWESWQEMEDTFPGLLYKSCTGMEDQGEPKTYSEEYAETSRPRVHLTPYVKTNAITFELVFIDVPASGSAQAVDRFDTYRTFLSYITGHRFRFTDSRRNIVRDMYLSGAAELSESAFYGGREYFIAKFPCTSLNSPESELTTDN